MRSNKLRLHLDFEPKRTFGLVLCNLIIEMGGYMFYTKAMAGHGYSETINDWTKYPNFVFLLAARLYRLVEIAPTSLCYSLLLFIDYSD